MSKVAALVLAAGRSTRMGSNKMLIVLDGKPLVQHVVETALASKANPVFVITGHQAELVEAALHGFKVIFVHNANYASGLSSSLICGVKALQDDITGVIVLLGDMPRISLASVNALVDAFEANPNKLFVVPVIGGERGNPVLLSRFMFKDIAQLKGDKGARTLIDEAGMDVLELSLNDLFLLVDADTPEMIKSLL